MKLIRVFLFVAAVWSVAHEAQAGLPDRLTVVLTNTLTRQPAPVDLVRYNLRASNYQVRIYADATNYTLLPASEIPEVTTYRGRIASDPGAMVVGAFDPSGNFIYLVTYGCREVNTWAMDPYDTTNRLMWGGWGTSIPTTNLPAVGTYAYAYQSNMPLPVAWSTNNYPASTPSYGGPPRFNYLQRVPAQRVRMIQDLSRECFINSCGSNIHYAVMMQESRVNEMDYLEARDFGICYQVVLVCIRPSTEAPFTSGGNSRLTDLRNYWQADPGWAGDYGQNTNSWFDMAQGTMNLGGGVAFCPGDFAITDPGFNGNVEAHEVGHNWGAGDVTSLWDYTGENSWHWTQTGSGYGHSTEMGNRALGIRRVGEYYKAAGYMEWVKYNSPIAPWATPDFATMRTGQVTSVNALVNDFCVNSSALAVVSFETNTPAGGLVTDLGGGVLQYAPPAGFTGYDWFHYYVGEGTGLKSLSEVHVRVEDPANPLLAQWSFEQTNGTALAEVTGRGVPGALKGTADFAAGAAAGINGSGALHLDGGGYVQFPGRWFDPLNGAWTLSLWVRPDATPASDQVLFSKSDRSGAAGLFLAMNASSFYLNGATFGINAGFSVTAAVTPQGGSWYHVVAEIDRTNNLARLWVNGVEYTGTWNTRALPAGEFIFGEAPPALGSCPGRGYNLRGALDEVRLYSRALSAAEVGALYVGGGMLGAASPSPGDGETGVALQPTLAWTAGRTNYQHDVYLGTNLAAVAAAGTNAPEYRGRVAVPSFAPGPLASNTTWYWRIDEVQGGTNIAAGVLWRFTTAQDALHGGLRLHLTLDSRDILGNVAYDLAGPPYHDGTIYNSPTASAGRVSEALDFNGTNSYIGLGNPSGLNFAGRLTIAAWIRPQSTNGLRNIIEHGYRTGPNQEVGLRISSGYYQILSWDGAGHQAQYAVPAADLTNWVHLAGEYDGTAWRLFRNGTQVAATTDATGCILVSDNWSVGATGSGTERFFLGGIDDVMIWNRALSAAEIGLLYTNGLAGSGIDGAPPAPQPGTFTWTGSADTLWTNAANWAANAVPGASDVALYDASSARNLSTDPGANLAVKGVAVSGNLRAVGILDTSDHMLTLGGAGIQMSNTVATLSLSASVTLSASQTWAVSASATLNDDGVVTQGANRLTWAVDGALTQNGVLNGTGGLTKNGAGTATINANQNFSGGVMVNGGTLQLNAGGWYVNPFSQYNVVTVNSGATLRTGGAHSLGVDQNTVVVNGGTLSLGAENYISGLAMTGGEVESGELRTWGGAMTFNASAQGAVISSPLTLVGSATLNVADGAADPDLHLRGAVGSGGGLTKDGAGTLLVTGQGAYSGSTALSAGRLQLASGDNRLPVTSALTLSPGATLEIINVRQSLTSVGGAGSILLSGGALILAPTGRVVLGSAIGGQAGLLQGSVADTIQTSGGLTKEGPGTLVLTNACTYSGDTYVAAGTLELLGAATLAASSNIIVDGGAALVVTGRPGGVFVLGSGRSLAGSGQLTGRLDNSGAVRPGSEGYRSALTISGTYTQQAAGRLEIDLTGAADFDRLAVGGAATLNGELLVRSTNGYVPGVGSSFAILSRASGTGTFSTLTLPLLATNVGWQIQYLPTGVVLSVAADSNANVVTVSAPDAAAAEEATNTAMFVLLRTGPLDAALTVSCAIGGTATPGLDYAALGASVLIPAGQSNAVLTITPVDDALVESPETITLHLNADSAYLLGSSIAAAASIVDNDFASTVTVSAVDATAAEPGPDHGRFVIARTWPTNDDLSVFVGWGGTATAGADYQALPASFVIPAGQTSVVVDVAPLDDLLSEGAENVAAILQARATYVLGSPSTASVALADNDYPPAIVLTQPRTNACYLPAGVGLVLAAAVTDDGTPVPPGATTVQWSRVSGPDAVSFGNAAWTNTTALFGSNGVYVLRLSAFDGNQTVATDLTVNVGLAPPAAAGGLTNAAVGGHRVATVYSVTNGVHTLKTDGDSSIYTGMRGDDFSFVYYRVAGNCSVTARITTVTPGPSANWARAGVMIRESLATNAPSTFVGLDGDSDRVFVYRAAAGATNAESLTAASTATYSFRLVRTGNTFSAYRSNSGATWTQVGASQVISMSATVLVGLAATSGDVVPNTNVFDRFGVTGVLVTNVGGNLGPLVYAGPDLVAALPATVALNGSCSDDGKPNPPGAVTMQWSKVTGSGGVAFGSPAATGTTAVVDGGGNYRMRLTADDGQVKTFDDALVTASTLLVRVSAPDANAAETNADPGTLVVSLDGALESNLVVGLQVGGTATPDLDYPALPTQVLFAAGTTSMVFTVTPVDDEIAEGQEIVTLSVLSAPAYAIAAPGTATVVIADNDPMRLRWAGTTNNAWDLGIMPNWLNLDGGAETIVFSSDVRVLFDDAPGVLTNIDLAAGHVLAPFSLTIRTDSNTFRIAGPGRLSGACSLTKTGASDAVLGGSGNDFTGLVFVAGGTLRAESPSALGSASAGTVLQGGALDVGGQALGAEPLLIAGSGSDGRGVVINTGAEQTDALQRITLSGDAVLGGTTRWDVRGPGAILDLAGHTLTKEGTNFIALAQAAVTNAGDLVVSNGLLGFESGSVLGGSGTVRVASSGRLQVGAWGASPRLFRSLELQGGGLGTYAGGGFTLVESPIQVTGSGSLFASPGSDLLVTNTISGPGALHKMGAGRVRVRHLASPAVSVMVEEGTLQFGERALPNGVLAVDVQVSTGAAFAVARSGPYTLARRVTGDGALVIAASNGVTTVASSNEVGRLVIAAGPARNTNSFALLPGGSLNRADAVLLGAADPDYGPYGRLEVQTNAVLTCGELGIGAPLAGFGDVVQRGGDVSVTNAAGLRIAEADATNEVSTYLLLAGRLAVTAGPLVIGQSGAGVYEQRGGTAMVWGVVMDAVGGPRGPQRLNLKDGTLAIGEAGFAAGGTNHAVHLDGGRLVASASWTSTVAMSISGAAGDFPLDTGAHVVTLAGPVDGPGALLKSGPGSLRLAGVHPLEGILVVEEGTLVVDGDVPAAPVWIYPGATLAGSGSLGGADVDGAVRPGHDGPGRLRGDGLYFSSSGSLEIEVGGLTPGTEHDQLVCPSSLQLSGTLDVTLVGGFVPALGQSFTAVLAGAISGAFASTNLPPLPPLARWRVARGADRIVLSVEAADTLTLSATDGAASESGDPGAFTLSRQGPTDGPLTAQLIFGGPAVGDVDYAALPAQVTLAVGQTATSLAVIALGDALSEGPEALSAALQPAATYIVGSPSSGQVVIADTPIDGWRFTYFGAEANAGAADDAVDADGDGWLNLAEYALGGNPTNGLPPPSPVLLLNGGRPELRYWRSASATGVTLTVIGSSAVEGPWTEVVLPADSTNLQSGELEYRCPIPADVLLDFYGLRITRP